LYLQSPVSLEKALSFEIRNFHFDQPSPTSVLDAHFEENTEKSPSPSENAVAAKQGKALGQVPSGKYLPIWQKHVVWAHEVRV
jgi:hypothetical protein